MAKALNIGIVEVDSKGLGEYDLIAELFVKRLKARAKSHSFLKH